MNISTNITCVSLNYQHLNERALSNLKKADLSVDEESLEILKEKIGLKIDSLAIIKKCNAIIIIISYSDDLSPDYVQGRILHSWDILSYQGISSFKRDIKFYENIEALKFLAECAVGIHSVTIGDSQVYSQIVDGLKTNITLNDKSVFDFIADWLTGIVEECKYKTDIFKGNTSLERIASELILQKITKNAHIALVGYGKSGKLIAKILSKENNIPLSIINRTPVSLTDEGLSDNVTYSSFESFVAPKNLEVLIVVVDNTKETDELISKIVQKISEKNVLCIDLSTPSILQGKVSGFIDITNLSDISNKTMGTRKDSVTKAKRIIDSELKSIVNHINAHFAAMYVNNQKGIAVPLENEEREHLIMQRGEMLRYIRALLVKEDYLEIITPFIVGISTDPPKVDKGGTINVEWMNGTRAFLRQSNQIYKQIYVASGIKKIYEIGPFWRKEVNESYRHLQESIGLDVERQNPKDLKELYGHACNIIRKTNDHLIKKYKLSNHLTIPNLKSIPVLTYHEAVDLLRENGNPVIRGQDFGLVSEAKLGQLIKKKYGSDILVIKNYPDTIKKFYTKQKEDGLTETFDIIVDGWELVSGAIRQVDGDLIRKSMRLSDINVSDYEFYIGIVDGAKEHGGFCLGLDRLLAKILDKEMVSDAVPFPRTYKQLIP